MRRCTYLLVVCLVAALATPAHARKPNPQAREAYQQALRRYDAGDYREAVSLFKRAYELEPVPLLLFNIAQAYRLQKDYVRAVETYGTYLRLLPDAPNRSDVEALIVRTSARLDENSCQPVPPEDGKRRMLLLPLQAPAPEPTATATAKPSPTPPAPPRRSHAKLIAGVVLAGVGVAGLATGGYLAARQSADADRIATLRDTHGAWEQATYDDGVASAAAANALFVTGAALAVTGGVLTILGVRSSARSHAWSVAPAARGAQAVWSCAF